jgi:hypothetical protein
LGIDINNNYLVPTPPADGDSAALLIIVKKVVFWKLVQLFGDAPDGFKKK